MAKNEDLTKHTLHLRRGDMERLRALFPEIGGSIVVRKLVSNFLDKDDGGHKKLEIDQEIDL